jgi:hypothetical protein
MTILVLSTLVQPTVPPLSFAFPSMTKASGQYFGEARSSVENTASGGRVPTGRGIPRPPGWRPLQDSNPEEAEAGERN